MSQELPPELRERVRAYVEDVAPAPRVDELEDRILEQLERRSTRQPAQVMAIAHETVSSAIRITPEAAAAALVDRGGLSPQVAAHIVGLPLDEAVADAEEPEDDAQPAGTEGVGEPAEPEGVDEPGEPEGVGEPTESEDEVEPVIDGWDDFWSPPPGGRTDEPDEVAPDASQTAEPEGTEGREAADPGPVAVRPDAEDRDAGPPAAPAVARTFETWTGGASRRPSGARGPLIAAAAGIVVVVLAIVGLMSIGGDGDPVAVGDPTGIATDGQTEGGADPDQAADEDPDDGPATEPDTAGTTTEPGAGGAPDAVSVADADIAGEDGGAVQAGGPALLSLTVSGTGDQPATLRWELHRDGDEVFPAAPLVVPADGDVRLTIPPALLADAGAYVVRVSHEGAVLFERDFEVAAG